MSARDLHFSVQPLVKTVGYRAGPKLGKLGDLSRKQLVNSLREDLNPTNEMLGPKWKAFVKLLVNREGIVEIHRIAEKNLLPKIADDR